MNDKQLENYFTAIKHDFSRMDERFDLQDELLNQIALTTATTLEIVKSLDVQHKEVKASIRELERRVTTLEKHPA